jgi:hypothetical protein
MDKDILALLLLNETVALGIIEPLHLSLLHLSPPALQRAVRLTSRRRGV